MEHIVIGQPYINNLGEVVRLESLIKGPDFEKIHYFEVQREYEKYLCYERSDAFVLSLFYFALVNGYDIQCEAPLSEKLFYQLTRILIPSMVKHHPDFFHRITVIAELDNIPIQNVRAVGAAVSGGVDSFYTIITNMNKNTKSFNVTHLLVANSYNIFKGDKDTRRRFQETANHSQIIADDLGLPLIRMYTNHSEFWFKRYQNIFCLKYASYPYALQKLFSTYHFSSGYEYSDFTMCPKDWDSAHYDPLSAPQVSNENFTFILSGAEVGRAEKIAEIADHPVVQRRLQVCNLHQENCSVCSKCMRTQFNLYTYGKLELFDKSFKLDEFYKRKNKTLVKMLSERTSFDQDNLKMMKQKKIEIPMKVKILGKFGRMYYLFKQLVKKIPLAYKLYMKLKGENLKNDIVEIEKYNTDKEYAKKCDGGIV